MKTKQEVINEIVTRLLEGQESMSGPVKALLEQDDLQDMSVILMFEVTQLFMGQPEQVDWKKFMNTVEALLWEPSSDLQKTVIKQGILETFAAFISDDTFSSHWILPHIGTRSRQAIQESDAFQKTKTPGF